MPQAYTEARAVDPIVFAERFIDGAEYTVSIVQERALPSIRIEPATEFFDYQAKYFRDDTKYHCPSGLGAAAEGVVAGRRARHLSRGPIASAGAASISCAMRRAGNSISSRSTRRPA